MCLTTVNYKNTKVVIFFYSFLHQGSSIFFNTGIVLKIYEALDPQVVSVNVSKVSKCSIIGEMQTA